MPAGRVGFYSGRERKRSLISSIFRFARWVFRFLFLAVFVMVIYTGVKLYGKYFPVMEGYYDYAAGIVEKSTPSDFKSVQTSYVYGGNGKQIAKLRTDKDVYYVKYHELPEDLIDAVVAIEDKRFWEHEGVDFLSTGKAAVLYLKDSANIVRGGSTITQQLVKNIYLSNEKSIERKAKEIFIALKLEERYTKEQILEFYLNNINFANGYYGIGAAAKGYFDKRVGELSLTEIAFLCAIPNNPTFYDPIDNTKNTTRRRNIILKEMWEQGYLEEETYLHASNEPIHFHRKAAKNYNYEVSYAIDCAVRVFMKEQGFRFRYSFTSMKQYRKYLQKYAESYQFAKTELYTGGYKVYTTLDQKVQKQLQKSIDNTLKQFKEKNEDGIYEMQGAATVVDNGTGAVIALVGGRSQDFNGILTLNRAYQSYRQPGSTFKPLAVYTPCFELGYSADTKVDDSFMEDGPVNSDGKYLGEIKLRKAVEKSKNVVAWRLMQAASPALCLSYVGNMNFTKIVPPDFNLSSALGGLTYGVTTVEMAGGYATLANDGVFREPTCIERIEYNTGKELVLSRDERRVYSVNSARTMTDVLQGVAKRGTAKGLDIGKMPVACKTGTTNGQTTGWFCGYTPYYTVCIYVGYDMNKKLSSLWGATYPLRIWESVQTYLSRGLECRAFPKPEKNETKPVNRERDDDDDGDSGDNKFSDPKTSVTVTPGPVVTPAFVKPEEPAPTEETGKKSVVPVEPVTVTEEPTEPPVEEPVEATTSPIEQATEEPVFVEETAEPTEEPVEATPGPVEEEVYE